VKALCYGIAAAAMMLTAQGAAAAALGEVEYARWTNSIDPFWADLGGVFAEPDALITTNDYNGAATLPGGLPIDYSIHLDRTYLGDADGATADFVEDRYLFKIDPASMGAAVSATGDATLTLVTGFDAGMTGVWFQLYETNADGFAASGPIATVAGAGNVTLAGMTPDQIYTLKVSGHLKTGAESTNTGRYDIVLGMMGITPIPVPPALLLFLSGLGAVFGMRRLRKESVAA